MIPQTIREEAWIGDAYVKGRIRGVVLSFHGLGGGLKGAPGTEELEWGRAGGLVVYPYYGPWAWMNRRAQAMVDDLVDAVYAACRLPPRTPLICTGGSMGGQASLLYTRYARRPVSACLANCPVCDLAYHFRERPDLPPTMRHASLGHEGGLARFLVDCSPLRQAAAMPDIPFRILHGDEDKAVAKRRHSDKMVRAMRKHGRKVEYVEVAGMGHCGPLPLAVLRGNVEFVAAAMRRS